MTVTFHNNTDQQCRIDTGPGKLIVSHSKPFCSILGGGPAYQRLPSLKMDDPAIEQLLLTLLLVALSFYYVALTISRIMTERQQKMKLEFILSMENSFGLSIVLIKKFCGA